MPRSAIINVMVQAAMKAGRSLARDFGEVQNLQVSLKGPGDYVSQADRKAEEIIHAELSRAALLHQEGVAGAGAGELGVDDLLRLAIGLADIVAGTFQRDLQVLHLAEIARQRAAGLHGGLDHDVEES